MCEKLGGNVHPGPIEDERTLNFSFVKRRMVPFPHLALITTSKSNERDDIEMHCHCRMPELKDIECTSKWFHVDCEVVPKLALDDSRAHWFCCYCKPLDSLIAITF